jgi:hypothetical protein
MSLAHKARLDRTDLVAMYAPTMGEERSAETVDAAVRALHLPPAPFDVEQAVSIVTEIGRAPGLVGLVSRLAIARLRAGQAYREAGGIADA